MGICYSEEEEWNTHEENYRSRRKNRKKNNYHSIIYEEKTIHESFGQVENSFRDDLHNQLNHIASNTGSITFGSLAEMPESELSTLHRSLEQINEDGEDFNPNEPILLCNLKTKNYLHTHKIKHPCSKKYNEVSACPYNSNHIVEYDLWKIIPISTTNHVYIYHPLTQTFLTVFQNHLVCGTDKKEWKIKDFGRRRNGGFIEIYCEGDDLSHQKKEETTEEGEKLGEEANVKMVKVCMTDEGGMLPNHRKLELTEENRIGNVWEIRFGEAELE